MIETVNNYAPNFKASVVGRQINSPLDLERTFGLIGGDIFHGALNLDQIFSARPMLGYGNYRGPLPGIYMCGSGTHPGGGVTGAGVERRDRTPLPRWTTMARCSSSKARARLAHTPRIMEQLWSRDRR